MPFSGSYPPVDVSFLLTPIDLAPTAVDEKERLIQSGTKHYSEMIGAESPPSAEYLTVFRAAYAANRIRYARDLARLALTLAERISGEITLVSLARAGTPIGVLVRRALALLGRKAQHYSISIIRDRGIDAAALDYILERHEPESAVVLDGWTGKGAIAGELERSLAGYNAGRKVRFQPPLAVVADLAGVADIAATGDDYLIPTSILNAVVSGLISRTILNEQVAALGRFHGCVVFHHLAEHDLSNTVADALTAEMQRLFRTETLGAVSWAESTRQALQAISRRFVGDTMARYGVADRNRVKPGIGEATRALLRRVPERLIVRDPTAQAVEHLLVVARSRNIAVEVDRGLPYEAAVIIQSLGSDS